MALAGCAVAPVGSIADEEVEVLRRRIVAAVWRTCPARLTAQLEDLVQTVLTQLTLSSRRSEGKLHFSSTYIAKAAYGAIVDELRRIGRRREECLDEAADALEIASREAGPEAITASREIARGIRDCLTRLVQSRRLAVALYIQGCTVPEAARVLRWSAKKTENLVYRGLVDLRACLAAKGLKP